MKKFTVLSGNWQKNSDETDVFTGLSKVYISAESLNEAEKEAVNMNQVERKRLAWDPNAGKDILVMEGIHDGLVFEKTPDSETGKSPKKAKNGPKVPKAKPKTGQSNSKRGPKISGK